MIFLIVEDDKRMADIFAYYLRPVSSQIERAETYREAADKLNQAGIKYDGIWLDLNLGDSRGMDTLLNIKKIRDAKQEQALIIVVSGTVLPQEGEEIIRNGADGFIHKNAINSKSTTLSAIRNIALAFVQSRNRPYTETVRKLSIFAEAIAAILAQSDPKHA